MIRMRLVVAVFVLAASLIGLVAVGALRRKGLGVQDARDRVGKEVTRGKALVGIAIDSSGAGATTSGIAGLSDNATSHEQDEATADQVDAVAQGVPVP